MKKPSVLKMVVCSIVSLTLTAIGYAWTCSEGGNFGWAYDSAGSYSYATGPSDVYAHGEADLNYLFGTCTFNHYGFTIDRSDAVDVFTSGGNWGVSDSAQYSGVDETNYKYVEASVDSGSDSMIVYAVGY